MYKRNLNKFDILFSSDYVWIKKFPGSWTTQNFHHS